MGAGGSIAGGGGDPTPTQFGPWPSPGWQFGVCVCVCVCVCVLCGGGVPTLVRRVRNHFHTVPTRLSGVCGLGWVNFDVFSIFCTFLEVPAGIKVYLVWFYGVLDRS